MEQLAASTIVLYRLSVVEQLGLLVGLVVDQFAARTTVLTRTISGIIRPSSGTACC